MSALVLWLEGLVLSPWFTYAAALVLIVVAYKVSNQSSIFVVLLIAGVLFAVSIFRTPPISHQSLIPRLLITICVSSIIGLGLCWLYGWRPSPATAAKVIDKDLQLRNPSVVVEPEELFLRATQGTHRFDLVLYNAGTSDLERIEIYEDYYNMVSSNPMQFQIVGPLILKPDQIIESLESKGRHPFSIDYSRALGSFMAIWKDAKAPQGLGIARIKFRYRRAFDGAVFTSGKVMMVSADDTFVTESGREVPGIRQGYPFPSLTEIGIALGIEQKRER